MELLLYAAAFTLWQSSISVSRGDVVIAGYFGRITVARGPGYRILSPWPGDLGLTLQAEPNTAASSIPEFRAALAAARHETRLLRATCSIYFVSVFAAMPLLIAWLGTERAWLLALPFIALLHIGALLALYHAERASMTPSSSWIQRWVGAALFPPALFRAPNDLVARRFHDVHPATAAAVLLEGELLVRLLREQIGRHDGPNASREALLRLCDESGIERSQVLTPDRTHPAAESYCPECLDEFLVKQGHCHGSGANSLEYRD